MEGVTTMNKDDMKILYAYSLFNGAINTQGKHCSLCQTVLKDNIDFCHKLIDVLNRLNIGYKSYDHGTNQVRLVTKAHPVFDKIYARTRHESHKYIDPHFIKMFDTEVFAIWCMASLYVDPKSLRLYSGYFVQSDREVLKKHIKNKFYVEMNLNKYGHGYIPKASHNSLMQAIWCHLAPSFRLKFERFAPLQGDEIV